MISNKKDKVMKRLEQFWFKCFSSETLEDPTYFWVRWVWYIILIIPLIIAVILDHFKSDYIPALIVFGCLFGPFVIIWIIVWFYHRWRVKKENK